VLARTRYGHPTRARRAAIMAVPKLVDGKKAREALEDLLDDSDPYLRIDVVRALVEIGDLKARGPLRARLDSDLDPRVRRRLREALRDLGGETKRATDQLREDFEKLSTEHTDLKARLSALEARLGDKDKAGPRATSPEPEKKTKHEKHKHEKNKVERASGPPPASKRKNGVRR
jgi:aminopeptidase N